MTIVDNCSQPGERALLRERADEVAGLRLLLADRNHGYGGAANLALDGDAELVCVSNADLLPWAGALSHLADAALGDPGAGMVGPVFEGGTQHYHARLPGPRTLLVRTFVGSWGRRGPMAPSEGQRGVIGQVSGACVVMRRELWERVGGFDEGFFLWYDDVDLAKRVVDLGYRNLVIGSAIVSHVGAGSFAQIEPATAQAIRLASLERYIGKHHHGWMPVARPLLSISRAIRADSCALDQVIGSRASGEEGHPPVPGEVLEVGRDQVP